MSNKAQQRTPRRFKFPTSPLGKSLAAIVALVIVALAALAITEGVGLASSSPQVHMSPAKATFFAKQANAQANAQATARAQPQRTKPPFVAETPQPTATLTAGIIQTHQGPFSSIQFSVSDMYVGPVGSHWDIVYAGTNWTTASTTGGQTGGRGALRISNYSGGYEGQFFAPGNAKWVNIISVSGTTLTLQSDKTASFTFDLLTNTYGA